MARFHARRSRPSVRGRPAHRSAALDRHDGRRYSRNITRLAAKPPHRRAGVVNSSGCHHRRTISPRLASNCRLDMRARLDGNRVHLERKAVRTHALPVHRAVLSCGNCACSRARYRHPPCRRARVVSIGSNHSAGSQAHLVGDRAVLGKILVAGGSSYITPRAAFVPGPPCSKSAAIR